MNTETKTRKNPTTRRMRHMVWFAAFSLSNIVAASTYPRVTWSARQHTQRHKYGQPRVTVTCRASSMNDVNMPRSLSHHEDVSPLGFVRHDSVTLLHADHRNRVWCRHLQVA